jgi:hypothetical protein
VAFGTRDYHHKSLIKAFSLQPRFVSRDFPSSLVCHFDVNENTFSSAHSCANIHDKKNVLKINFHTIATAIRCYHCNSSDTSTPFQCGEWFDRYDQPDLQLNDCSNVHGAKYCIKHIGRFEGLEEIFLGVLGEKKRKLKETFTAFAY